MGAADLAVVVGRGLRMLLGRWSRVGGVCDLKM